MAEPEEKRGPLGLFFANDLNDPRVNPQLRQRIALQMLSQQKGFPKTFGEGLGAIGDAIGDRAMMNRLAQADIAGSEQRTRDIDEVRPPPIAALPTNARAEVPTDVAPPVVTAALQQPTNVAPPPVVVPPQTRSMAPPDIPPAVMENPQGVGIQTPIQPPGAALDPRARAALLLASRLQGGTPVNPTAAGAQTPASPASVPVASPAAGGEDFSSQQRPGSVTRDIRPAPPPGYEPPSFEPYTDTQRKAILKARSRPYDAALQEDMQKIIAEEEVGRQQRQKVRDDLRAFNSPAAQLERAKKQADLDKIRADMAAGKIIQMDGRLIRIGDDGKPTDITPPSRGAVEGGAPEIKMTQSQEDTTKFYKMGVEATGMLEGKDRILAEGLKDEALGKVPFVGNKLLSSQYRAAKNAAGLLVQADLRDTSGATIGTKEFADRFDLLIPKYGDDALQIAQKARARKAVLEGQRLSLGNARPMADYIDKEHAKERTLRQVGIAAEMAGVEKIVGKPYENKKTGKVRVWNGNMWEEH